MRGSLFVVGAVLVAGSAAQADIVINGTINKAGDRTTLDRVRFEVTANGRVDFDVLAWELDLHRHRGVDVNGDGEIAIVDPFIRIHRFDGHLDPSDFVAGNDNSTGTFGDGSIESFDSFMSLDLASGQYVLTIGGSLAITGMPGEFSYPDYTLPPGTVQAVDHGDYQVIMHGPVAVVPTPGTAALLGLGGLAMARRRR